MEGRIPGVYITNLPRDIDHRSIFEHFKRTWGLTITGVKLVSQDRHGAAALVDLPDHEAAEQVWPFGCCCCSADQLRQHRSRK